MTAPPIARHHLSEHSEELLPVVVTAIDPLPSVAARGHVIDRAGELEAEWARHGEDGRVYTLIIQDLTP